MAKKSKELRGKYIILVERLTESMAACDVRIIPKFGDTKKALNAWAREKYPEAKAIILVNTPELENFFDLASVWSDEIRR